MFCHYVKTCYPTQSKKCSETAFPTENTIIIYFQITACLTGVQPLTLCFIVKT